MKKTVCVLILSIIFFNNEIYAATKSSSPEKSNFDSSKVKRVFVLNSFNIGYSWTDNMLNGINDEFKNSSLNIETSTMFMDMKRIHYTKEYFFNFKETIKSGYKNLKFDAVLVCDNDAFSFIKQYRDELFPGVPVVFSSINDFSSDLLEGLTDITGTSENTDYAGTIQSALTILPGTKNIVVVVDESTTGQAHRSAVKKIENAFSDRVTFSYLSLGGFSLEELGQELSKLNNGSIVLLLQHFIDKNGYSYSIQQSTPVLSSICPVPCFILTDIRLGFGPVGGRLVSGYYHGKASANMIVSILKGKDIRSIPVMLESPNMDMYDYKALKRFKISESSLPKGSIIINKPESVLIKYKKEAISLGLFFVLILSSMIFMTFEIFRRKKAENALLISESLLRETQHLGNIGGWEYYLDTKTFHWTDEVYNIHELDKNYDPNNIAQNIEFYDPEDRAMIEKAFKEVVETGEPYNLELKFTGAKGTKKWVRTLGRAEFRDEKIIRAHGYIIDITNDKKNEKELKRHISEKEVLLRELYHRTKNNMQVISSMLQLQLNYSDDLKLKAILKDINLRIQSMSLVHQKLYLSQHLSKIDLCDYSRDLINSIFKYYSTSADRINVLFNMEKLDVTIDTAIPCGLILNELISNIFKYAFPDERKGTITIEMRRLEDDGIFIKIADNGIGFQFPIDLREMKTLGIQIVLNIVEYQLQGKIDYKNENGISWTINFKDIHKKERI